MDVGLALRHLSVASAGMMAFGHNSVQPGTATSELQQPYTPTSNLERKHRCIVLLIAAGWHSIELGHGHSLTPSHW